VCKLVNALASIIGFGIHIFGAKVSPLETVDGAKIALFTVRQTYTVEELARAISIPDLDAGLAKGV
jgi:hypothetical protein